MKKMISNAGYFAREAITVFRLNPLSNLLSLISTGLIFFVLAMVVSGWWAGGKLVEAIENEAEISVYFEEGMEEDKILQLEEQLKRIPGVRETALVDESQAYSRMEEILGKEAKVLKYLDTNPFSPFIEVKIQLEEMDGIIERLSETEGVDYVRDNREVLQRLQSIIKALELLGYLVAAAVGVSTLIIVSHIIRLGVYNNREQINTLRLLGAPETFIAVPFLITGLLLTLGGGIIASALTAITVRAVYVRIASPLPFIPLPSREVLVSGVITLIIPLSAVLGIAGSLFGLSSGK